MRIKAKVAYDGTAYGGWQVQKNANTVQAEMERAYERITGIHAHIQCAGRTDAGVHALGQTVHFDIETTIPPHKLPFVFNTHLPHDIRMLEACEAAPDFHACYCAAGKCYEYNIWNAPHENPLLRRTSMHVPVPLQEENMRAVATVLTGTHDFAAFCAAGAQVKTTVRTVSSIEIRRCGNLITLSVCGTGFLYNMVRIIAGTLILAGEGKYTPEQAEQALNTRLRKYAGFTAEPNGLILKEVYYE